MMRRFLGVTALAGALLLAACGVPREAGVLAHAWSAAATQPADDAGVRAELAAQAREWTAFEQLARQNVPGGTPVDAAFVDLVARTAAAARRQAALSAAGQDDPALNRQVLDELQGMWRRVDIYLDGQPATMPAQ